MGSRRDTSPESRRTPLKPAATLEGRENQLVSLAMDLAERQLLDGTASAQVISHFVKLGSTRERLEQQRLTNENILLGAKAEQISSSQRQEELYKEALNAMREYSGQDTPKRVADDDD